jgi:hypothetical protein
MCCLRSSISISYGLSSAVVAAAVFFRMFSSRISSEATVQQKAFLRFLRS